MEDTLAKIKKLRGEEVSDENILKEVIKDNPHKKKSFENAQKRGASASQILERIIKENAKEREEKVLSTIEKVKKLRSEGAEDENILKEVIKDNPHKKKAFEDAQKRGATPSFILEKLIEENREAYDTGTKPEKGDPSAEPQDDVGEKKPEDDVDEVAPQDDVGEKKPQDDHGDDYDDDSDDSKEQEEVVSQSESEKAEKEEKTEEERTPEEERTIQEARKRAVEEAKGVELEKKEAKEEEEKKEEEKKITFGQKVGRKITALKGTQILSEFFAITRYLLVGVDISDYSIEVLLIDKNGIVNSYGRSLLEKGVVENGEILNQKRLSEALRDTLKNTKPQPLHVPEHTRKKPLAIKRKEHKAIVSLPESKTYVQVFNFENEEDIYGQIERRIKETVPEEEEELYWDFIKVPGEERGAKVLCVAVQQSVVDMYIHFFKSTNVEPVAFEIEGAAIGRALLPLKKVKREKKEETVMADSRSRMILDMGARTTVLSVFGGKASISVSAISPYAGNYFTKKVAEYFDISEGEAEKMKQNEGFKEDGKTYDALKEHGKKIVKEAERAAAYHKREFGKEIKEVLLAGGTSLLPGIVDFLNKESKELKFKLGNPLSKINDMGLLNEKEGVLYANVIGLGLRSLYRNPIKDGINLLPEEVQTQETRSQKETTRSVLLVALFISLTGVALLGLAIYFLIYLPVPAPMQPLQDRVRMVLEEEVEHMDVVVISEDIEEDPEVYRGPGEEQEVVGTATRGEEYRATAQRGGWVRIEIEEEVEGWVHGENVEAIKTIKVEEEVEEPEEVDVEEDEVEVEEEDVVVVSGRLLEDPAVYERPEGEGRIIGVMAIGEEYEVVEQRGDWVRIKIEEGVEGWIHAGDIEEL